MARRLPSPPPVLPGFSHIHVLGSGGFADVFLFEQNMPRRQVAIKVMLSEMVNDQVRQMFQAEANLMARLSAHPAILTVYQASVSADGRPYLVMEFCSSALSQRYRRERIPVPEVLRIAVKIGGAIETAHRAGVLHRDIKPSNILLTAYGHPVLSDFGIASTGGELGHQQAVGMSIPWSAPEVLHDDTPGTIQSEVWSFAATVYSLLAGRSPFEIAGEPNKQTVLMARIDRARVPPVGRPDVPVSLERILQKAMSRRQDDRPRTVLELVRQLQTIESELGVPQTPVEVEMDDWALENVSDLEDKTRIRPVATAATSTVRRRRRAADVRSASLPVESRAQASDPRSGSATVDAGAERRGRRWMIPLIVGAALFAVGIGAAVTAAVLSPGDDAIPVVTGIESQVTGDAVVFSWTDPGLLAADNYQISASDQEASIQSRPEFAVNASDGEVICITVTVNRDGRTGQASNEKCVEFSS